MSEWIEGETVFRAESGEPFIIKKVYKNGNFILDEEHFQQYRPSRVGGSAFERGEAGTLGELFSERQKTRPKLSAFVFASLNIKCANGSLGILIRWT